MAESKPIILKFHKTNYVHFTTKKNMSANLKMGFHKILSPIAPTKNSWGWEWIIHCLGVIILIDLWKS